LENICVPATQVHITPIEWLPTSKHLWQEERSGAGFFLSSAERSKFDQERFAGKWELSRKCSLGQAVEGGMAEDMATQTCSRYVLEKNNCSSPFPGNGFFQIVFPLPYPGRGISNFSQTCWFSEKFSTQGSQSLKKIRVNFAD
jgi:hypothetical protein